MNFTNVPNKINSSELAGYFMICVVILILAAVILFAIKKRSCIYQSLSFGCLKLYACCCCASAKKIEERGKELTELLQ